MGAEHCVEDGGEVAGLEVCDLPMEAGEDLGRVVAFERVGAQGAAQSAHDYRDAQSVAGHVADDDAEMSGWRSGAEPGRPRSGCMPYCRRVRPEALEVPVLRSWWSVLWGLSMSGQGASRVRFLVVVLAERRDGPTAAWARSGVGYERQCRWRRQCAPRHCFVGRDPRPQSCSRVAGEGFCMPAGLISSVVLIDGALRVDLCGELAYPEVREAQDRIHAAIQTHRPRVVLVDLAEVSFIDTAGFGLLVTLVRDAAAFGARARFGNPTPIVRARLRLAGLLQLLDFAVPDLEEDTADVSS